LYIFVVLISFHHLLANTLAKKSMSEMTCFVLSGMLNLNLVSQSVLIRWCRLTRGWLCRRPDFARVCWTW